MGGLEFGSVFKLVVKVLSHKYTHNKGIQDMYGKNVPLRITKVKAYIILSQPPKQGLKLIN